MGKQLTLGTRAYSIVGVLAPGFEMTRYWHEPDVIDAALWRPIVSDGSDNYGPRNGFLSALGRLRPGVTMQQASAEAARLTSSSRRRACRGSRTRRSTRASSPSR